MSSLKVWLLFLLFFKPYIDRSQQAVSADIDIVQYSAARKLFPIPYNRRAKDKTTKMLVGRLPNNFGTVILWTGFPTLSKNFRD